MQKQLAAVILAAGESKRLGRPKQLLEWRNRTLLNHTIDQLAPLEVDLYVILGAHSDTIVRSLTQQSKVILYDHWHDGLGSTIAYAAGKLKDDYSHLLFTLCDLPLIETSFYQSLLDTSRKYPGSLVASKKNGRVMVPAIFNSSAYTELLRLSGDKGAGELLNRGKKDVVSLEATDIWMDIDKMADYESLIAREQPGKQ